MAGDWIKIEDTLPDKPEVIRIASELNLDQDAITGKLIRIWIWADKNTISGNAVPVTSSFLDRITSCPGFAAAMRKVGWLEGRDGSLSFPRFDRHNGQTAKQRCETNRRVAKSRANKNVTEKKVKALKGEIVTQRPLQKALPEKRREECITSDEVIHPLNPPAGESVGECLDASEVPVSDREPGIADIGQPIGESHPHITCLRVGGAKGQVISFDEDPPSWVAEFIRLWNKLAGVSKHTNKALDTIKYRELCYRLRDTDWDWKAAFLKFPLAWPVGKSPTLSWFLKPDSVSKILDGVYATTTAGGTEGGLFSRRATGPSEATRIRTGETAAHVAAAFAQAGQANATAAESSTWGETGSCLTPTVG